MAGSEVDVAMCVLGPWLRQVVLGVLVNVIVLAATGCGSSAPNSAAGGDVAGGDAAQVTDAGSGAGEPETVDAASAADVADGESTSDASSTSDAAATTDGAALSDGVVAADASALDVGAPDTGSPDAGSPDAGSPDAGSADAGPLDAGSVDAGPFDAGEAVDAVPGGSTCDELTVAISKELKVVAACAADADCTVLQTGLCPFAGMPCGGVAVNKSQKLEGLQALLSAAAMPCNVAMCKCMPPPAAVCQQGQCAVP